ncbi:tetratricopeptide repeat protein [Propylenella binzhouense]|uniref:tetratricopeptide repeat protein n=1 Tax=Propylenella binzhouense TaxID=2555902 RepID=UPI003CCDC6B3
MFSAVNGRAGSALLAAALALGMVVSGTLASSAMAAGGGGGGGGGGAGGAGSSGGGSAGGGGTGGNEGARGQGRATDLNTCRKGLVWDRQKHMCVTASRDALPDEEMAEYAFALAKAERFDEALGVLDLLRDPNTARALNYRGYATRKLGRLDEGIGYYLRSTALDPTYAQVREYLGEAYVIKGRLDLAQEQLDVIRGLCGTTCEEYEDLAEAIEAVKG